MQTESARVNVPGPQPNARLNTSRTGMKDRNGAVYSGASEVKLGWNPYTLLCALAVIVNGA